MILSTVGRGGEGDVGQRIRDEILVIQVNIRPTLWIFSSLHSFLVLPLQLLLHYANVHLNYMEKSVCLVIYREKIIAKVE